MSSMTQTSPQPRLDRSIGLGRVLFQAVGVMGPGASIVFGLGLIIANTGKASPFAMVLALIAAVFVAIAIGQLAARIPGAGGLYSFAATVFGSDAGFMVGWGYAIMTFILPTHHEAELQTLRRGFVRVMDSDEIVSALKGVKTGNRSAQLAER